MFAFTDINILFKLGQTQDQISVSHISGETLFEKANVYLSVINKFI